MGAVPALSALAGTLTEAVERGASVAVLVVHVFTSSATRTEKVKANRAALSDFISRLAGGPVSTTDGVLYGPYPVPGANGIPAEIPVLIGEVATQL